MTRQANVPSTLNRLLNAAIIVAAVFLLGVLAKKLFWDQPPDHNYRIATNARLAIKDVDWTKTDRTLLIALGKECKYCAESARFYRRLVQALADKDDTRMIALFSEKEVGGEAYLKELGISVSDLSYVSLSSVGIKELPTLAIVDRNGTVIDMWVGRLPPRIESAVMHKLNLTETRPLSEWLIEERTMRLRLAKKEPIVLLDVRDRAAFALEHKTAARNIPLDELKVRAINELPAAHTVVLDGENDSATDMAYTVLEGQGFADILILARNTLPQPGQPPKLP